MATESKYMEFMDEKVECALQYLPSQEEMRVSGRLQKLICLSIFRPETAKTPFSHTKYWQGIMGWLDYGPKRYPGYTIRIYFDASLCDVEVWQGVLRRMAERAKDPSNQIQLVKFTCPRFLMKDVGDKPCTYHTGLFGTMVRFLGWFEDPRITEVVAFRDLDLTPLKEDYDALEKFVKSRKAIGIYDWYSEGGCPNRLKCFCERVEEEKVYLVAAGLWCAHPLGEGHLDLWRKMLAMYKDERTKECMLMPGTFGLDEIILNTAIWNDLKIEPSQVDFMPTWLASAMQHFSIDGTPFYTSFMAHKHVKPVSSHPDTPLTLQSHSEFDLFAFEDEWEMPTGRQMQRREWERKKLMDLHPRDTCEGIHMLLSWVQRSEGLEGQWIQLYNQVSRVISEFMLHRRGLNLGMHHDTRRQRRLIEDFLKDPSQDIRFRILTDFQQFLFTCDREGYLEGLRSLLYKVLKEGRCAEYIGHFFSSFLCKRGSDRARHTKAMVEDLLEGIRDKRVKHEVGVACRLTSERNRDRDRH